MSAVLGIKAIQPCPHGELRVIYDLGGDKTATLAIYSDVQKRILTGASVSALPLGERGDADEHLLLLA